MSHLSLIKKVRKRKKVTQKEMAAALGCNLKTYQRFENGKGKRVDMLSGACKKLGLMVLIVEDENIKKW